MLTIINPMANMPWEIYLDFLADQGFDELRNIDPFSLTTGIEHTIDCHQLYFHNRIEIDAVDRCILNNGHSHSFGDPSFCYEDGVFHPGNGFNYDNNFYDYNCQRYGHGDSFLENFSGAGSR